MYLLLTILQIMDIRGWVRHVYRDYIERIILVNMKIFYRFLAHFTAFVHTGIIIGNLLAVPFIVWQLQWYISIPLITVLVSPVTGGANCFMNNAENYFRFKGMMRPIVCRSTEILKILRLRGR